MIRNSTILMLLFLLLVSCGKDEVIKEEPTLPDETENLYEIDVLGFASNIQGLYTSDVTVTIGGEAVNTDETGLFHFDNLLIGSKGKVVEYSSEGYLPSYYRVYNYESLEAAVLNLTLIEAETKVNIGADGGTILSDDMSIIFNEGSVPNSTEFTYVFQTGKDVGLGNGDPLFFQNGTKFLLKQASLFIDGNKEINEGFAMNVEVKTEAFSNLQIDELAIFFYDTDDLTWKEKAISMENKNGKVAFPIDEYGWWAIAEKVSAQKGFVTLLEDGGVAINNAEVSISFGKDKTNGIRCYSDSEGKISAYFPIQTETHIGLNKNEFEGMLGDGFSLGDEEEELTISEDVQFDFTGQVYTCEFDESGGFVAMITDGQHKIRPIKDGVFEAESFEGDGNAVVHFYNENFEYMSSEERLNQSFKETKSFISCDDLTDNLTVSDGSNLMLDFDMCRVKVRPNETVIIGEKTDAESFLVSFGGKEEGVWDGLFYFPPLLDDVKSDVIVNVILFDQEENKVAGYIETEYIQNGEKLVISFIGNID